MTGTPLKTPEEWRSAVDQLLMSTVFFARETLPRMQKNKWGRLITITSSAVKQPVDGLLLSNSVRAAVTGSVWQITVPAGTRVAAGDRLVVLETMKMETLVTAPRDGIVETIHCKQGALVLAGALLYRISTELTRAGVRFRRWIALIAAGELLLMVGANSVVSVNELGSALSGARRSNDALDPLPLLSRPLAPHVAGVDVETRRG